MNHANAYAIDLGSHIEHYHDLARAIDAVEFYNGFCGEMVVLQIGSDCFNVL